jgi:hypothetical protein
MENCLKLLFAGQFAEFYYSLPFAMWFTSLCDPEILLSWWEHLIEVWFRCFVNGFRELLKAFDGDRILRIPNLLLNMSQSCLI